MGKGQNQRKETKKKAAKTLQEKTGGEEGPK
jgi:hypothetical protein